MAEVRERVDALRREIARQDEEWARAQGALRAMGEVQLEVPEEFLEALDRACAQRMSGLAFGSRA